jgi:bifunctional non-homologous end joining protein LigD
LIKHRDEFASAEEAQRLLDMDKSVASGRSMGQIEAGKGRAPAPFMLAADAIKADAVWRSNRENKAQSILEPETKTQAGKPAKAKRLKAAPTLTSMPAFIEPQLCKLVERPPAAAGWAHEVKFDGYRAQLRVARGVAQIRTRSGLDWTEHFAAIAKHAADLTDCIRWRGVRARSGPDAQFRGSANGTVGESV